MKINNLQNNKIESKKTKKPASKKEAEVQEPKDQVTIGSQKDVKEVTFMNYMDGSNNLEHFILQNLKDMEQVGSTKNMNIIAQFSRHQIPPLTKFFFGQALKEVVNDPKFLKKLEKELKDPDGVQEFKEMFADQHDAGYISEKILNGSTPLMQGITELINGVASDMSKDKDMGDVLKSSAMELAIETVGGGEEEEEVKSAALGIMDGNKGQMSSLAMHMKNAITKFLREDMKGDGKIYVAGPYKGGRAAKSAEADGVDVAKEPEWIGVRRYYVTKGDDSGKISSPILEDMGMPNMGEKETLTDFLVWGITNYPAKKYVVVLGDHGAGIMGAFEDRGKMMTLPHINEAMAEAEKKTGVKPDVLVFDCCLMAQAEVGYELKDRANIMVASEETVGGYGLPYVPILKGIDKMAKKGKLDDVSVANLIISESEETSEDVTVTYSAIDLTKMDNVKKAIDKMAKAFTKANLPMEDVKFLIHNTTHFSQGETSEPYGDFRDLGHFTDNVLRFKDMTPPEVQKAAKEVKEALSEAVIAEEHNEDYGPAYGMTFYAPNDKRWVGDATYEEYKNTAMAKDTLWDEFLENTFGIGDLEEDDDEERKSRKPQIIHLPQRH